MIVKLSMHDCDNVNTSFLTGTVHGILFVIMCVLLLLVHMTVILLTDTINGILQRHKRTSVITYTQL